MKKRNHNEIREQVELTMGAFRTDEPPEMDPWFYEHLQNRIDGELTDNSSGMNTWWNRALQPGLLVGLVALNVVMIFWMASPTEITTSSQTSNIENLSSQYALNFSDTYLLDSGE